MDKNYDEFFNLYKLGEVVYPRAVSRYYGLSYNEAYTVCERMVDKDVVKKICIPRCPKCDRLSQERLQTLSGSIVCCENCDEEFSISDNKNTEICYERI